MSRKEKRSQKKRPAQEVREPILDKVDDLLLKWATGSRGSFVRIVSILGAITIGMAVVFSIVKINNAMINTVLSLPGGISLFLLVSIILVQYQEKNEQLPFRFRQSAAQRRRTAMIFSTILIIASIAGSSSVPVIINGTLFIAGALAVLNFLRMTPEEFALDLEGLPDPRDVLREQEENQLDDVLPDDFTWEPEDFKDLD